MRTVKTDQTGPMPRLWVDAQADLSLCWAHMPFCWFCNEAAQILGCSTAVHWLYFVASVILTHLCLAFHRRDQIRHRKTWHLIGSSLHTRISVKMINSTPDIP